MWCCAIRGGSTSDAIGIDPPQTPRRWAVEQTFSWFGRNRRLAKEFENLAVTPARFATLAFILSSSPSDGLPGHRS